MTIGVQLNLTYAFNPHFGVAQHSIRLPTWLVLGDPDYLELRNIESFSDFFQPARREPTLNGSHEDSPVFEWVRERLGCEKHINLVHNPFEPNESAIADAKSLCTNDDSFLFWIQLTASPTWLDFSTDFEMVRKQLIRIETYVRETYGKKFGFTVLWSLGSFDLALLRTSNRENDVQLCHQFVNLLRTLKYGDVFGSESNGSRFEYELLAERRKGIENELKDEFVFTTVTASLACNLTKEFTSTGSEGDLVVRTRFKAKKGFEKLLAGSNTPLLGLEPKWIHRDFHSVSAFVKWFKTHCWSEGGCRIEDFGSSFTEILLHPDNANTLDMNNVRQTATQVHSKSVAEAKLVTSESFSASQRAIDNGLKAFADSQIGPTQGTELVKVLTTYYQALARTDRLSAMRDLTPFFLQLSDVLGDSEWGEYLASTDYSRELTSVDLSYLTNHLWRAIRNRIESHCEHTDPLLPASSENVAVKLLNAYTVAAWLCSDLLLQERIDRSTDCDARTFGVCVCTGSAGRVEGKELFREFRNHCERVRLSKGGSTDKEVSPLLLLNISGPILFRPEAAFAHCLHEMAEFSNWLATDNNGIKAGFSWHSYRCIESLFFSLVQATPGIDQLDDQFAFDVKCLLRLSVVDLPVDGTTSNPRNWEDVDSLLMAQLSLKDPLRVSSFVLSRWLELASEDRWEKLCRSPLMNHRFFAARKLISNVIRQSDRPGPGFGIREFRRRIEEYDVLIREIAADFGMILMLRKLKLERPGTVPASFSMQEDINYAFYCLLEGAMAWLPEEARIPKVIGTIIARWATLHRGVSFELPFDEWRKGFREQLLNSMCRVSPIYSNDTDPAISENFKTLNKDFDAVIDNFQDFCLFDDLPGRDRFYCLASVLFERVNKSFSATNTSSNSRRNETDEKYITRLHEIFVDTWDAAVKAHSSQQHSADADQRRLVMVLEFWAKSQKFCVKELFELVVSDPSKDVT